MLFEELGQYGLESVGGKKSRNLLWRGDARREVLFNFERTIKIEKNDIFVITPNMLSEELGQYGLKSVGGKKSWSFLWPGLEVLFDFEKMTNKEWKKSCPTCWWGNLGQYWLEIVGGKENPKFFFFNLAM